MTRPCLALAVVLALFACAPLFAQEDAEPTSPEAEFAKIEALRKTRPKGRAAALAYRKQLAKLAQEFVDHWERKADTPGARLGLAKSHLLVATYSMGKPRVATLHLGKAEAHAKECKQAAPADPEADRVLKAVAMLRPALAKLTAVSEQRAESSARRELLHGKLAPGLEIDEVLGGAPAESLALEKHRGKVVLLDFWATWSAPCRSVIPHLVELKKQHGDSLVVLGVTKFYGRGYVPGPEGKGGESKKDLDPAAEREVNRQCAATLGMDYPVVFSPKAAKAYHVEGIPQLVLIDKQGKVRHVKVGAGKTTELDRLIEECLAE